MELKSEVLCHRYSRISVDSQQSVESFSAFFCCLAEPRGCSRICQIKLMKSVFKLLASISIEHTRSYSLLLHSQKWLRRICSHIIAQLLIYYNPFFTRNAVKQREEMMSRNYSQTESVCLMLWWCTNAGWISCETQVYWRLKSRRRSRSQLVRGAGAELHLWPNSTRGISDDVSRIFY